MLLGTDRQSRQMQTRAHAMERLAWVSRGRLVCPSPGRLTISRATEAFGIDRQEALD